MSPASLRRISAGFPISCAVIALAGGFVSLCECRFIPIVIPAFAGMTGMSVVLTGFAP